MVTNDTAILTASLVIILILALLANYYIYKQQQRKLQRALMSRKIKHEMEQILDVLATLKRLPCPATVINLLNEHVVKGLAKLNRLKPETGMIGQLQSQTGVLADSNAPLNLEGEKAMRQAHSAIQFTIRFCYQRRNAGDISALQCNEASTQLQWLDSQIEIETHINSGKRLLENDKLAVAVSRFKHAKTFIIRLSAKNPHRQELIIEINKLIAQALPFSTDKSTSGNASKAG